MLSGRLTPYKNRKRRSRVSDVERAREDEAARAASYNVLHEPTPLWSHSPKEGASLTSLQTSIQRLNQAQSFLREDPVLMHTVDAAIAKRAQVAQRWCHCRWAGAYPLLAQ
jgi:hypothetical protein